MIRGTRRDRGDIRAAKETLKQQLELGDHGRLRSAVRANLFPGFRDRLLATIRTLEEVRAGDFDDELYVDYLAAIGGTARQTVRRWVDKQEPGLPDLVSFATLCRAIGIDAAWILGLTTSRLQAVQTGVGWFDELVSDIGRAGEGLVGIRVDGDEMEPDIRSGDWALIDTKECEWGSGGLYALELPPAASEIGGFEMPPSLLFVDDERPVLSALRALFRVGYKVATTTNGREAIRLVKQQHVDVIISDQWMPRMTGKQLMQAVSEIAPSTVRVLMTDYADQEAILDAISEAKVQRIVLKPWNNEKLKQVVDESVLLAKTLSRAVGENPSSVRRHDDQRDSPDLAPAAYQSLHERSDRQQDRMTVLRNIAERPDGGFTVSCSNPRYSETVIKDESHAKALGIRICGRVKMKISCAPT